MGNATVANVVSAPKVQKVSCFNRVVFTVHIWQKSSGNEAKNAVKLHLSSSGTVAKVKVYVKDAMEYETGAAYWAEPTVSGDEVQSVLAPNQSPNPEGSLLNITILL